MKSLAFNVSILYLAFLFLLTWYPSHYFLLSLVLLVVVLFLVAKKYFIDKNKLVVRFFYLPILVMILSLFFYLFLQPGLLMYLFVGVSVFFLYRSISCLNVNENNKMFYVSCLLFLLFIFYSTIFKIFIIWSVDLLYLSLITLIISILISYEVQEFICSTTIQKRLVSSLIMGVISLEFFWIISFFPTSYFVNAGVLTIIYNLFFSLIKESSLDLEMNKKYVISSVVVNALALFIIIITANWF